MLLPRDLGPDACPEGAIAMISSQRNCGGAGRGGVTLMKYRALNSFYCYIETKYFG